MKSNRITNVETTTVRPALAKLPVSRSAFDEAAPCYCSLCERTYKNYERFKKHLLKVHYNPKHYG